MANTEAQLGLLDAISDDRTLNLWLNYHFYTVSTPDVSCGTRQKQTEPIIISVAVYTGSDTTPQIPCGKLMPRSIFDVLPSAHATSDTNDKWICNGRFVVYGVDSL